MITVSVNCAFFARGSPNAITPFDTASTPVIAAHPLENAFISIHMPRYFTVCGSAGGIAATGTGWKPADHCLVHAHADHGQQRPDKQERRQHERRARVPHPAHVHQRQHRQNQQAEPQRMRLQARNAEVTAVTPAEIPTAAVRI